MHQHALVIDPGWLIWDRDALLPVPDPDQFLLAESLVSLLQEVESRKVQVLLSQEFIDIIFSEFPYEASTRNPFRGLVHTFTTYLRKNEQHILDPGAGWPGPISITPALTRAYFTPIVSGVVENVVCAMHHTHLTQAKLSLISHPAIWSHAGHAVTDDGATRKTYQTHAGNGTEPEIAAFLGTVKNTFEHNPKHGLTPYYQSGNLVSPLLTPHDRAEALLQQAIGENRHADEELFAYDDEIARFIVFKQTHPGKSVYHAYNPEAPDEVPGAIRARLVR